MDELEMNTICSNVKWFKGQVQNTIGSNWKTIKLRWRSTLISFAKVSKSLTSGNEVWWASGRFFFNPYLFLLGIFTKPELVFLAFCMSYGFHDKPPALSRCFSPSRSHTQWNIWQSSVFFCLFLHTHTQTVIKLHNQLNRRSSLWN